MSLRVSVHHSPQSYSSAIPKSRTRHGRSSDSTIRDVKPYNHVTNAETQLEGPATGNY